MRNFSYFIEIEEKEISDIIAMQTLLRDLDDVLESKDIPDIWAGYSFVYIAATTSNADANAMQQNVYNSTRIRLLKDAAEIAEFRKKVAGMLKLELKKVENVAELRKKALRQNLEAKGCIFVSENSVKMGRGNDYGNQILCELLYSRKEGVRMYRINEIDSQGDVLGLYGNSCIFKATELKAKAAKLEEQIKGFVDDFGMQIESLMSAMAFVEEHRLLKVTERAQLDAETKTTEMILGDLQNVFLNRTESDKTAVIEQNGKWYACIVGRGVKSSYQHFKEILQHISPENSPKKFKDEIIRKGLLHCDSSRFGDCQLTLSAANIVKHKVKGDKVYAIKFKKEIVEQIVKEWSNTPDVLNAQKMMKKNEVLSDTSNGQGVNENG